MSFADSMYARGLDPAAVHALLEKLRGVDSGDPGEPDVEHRDERGAALAPASSLAAAEVRLWIDAMAARYDDLREGTPMAKLVDAQTSAALQSGAYRPEVGGFTGVASHGRGLGSAERCQMAGLDSDHHARTGFFDPATNRWSAHHVDELQYPYRAEMGARVPLGSAAAGLMGSEAARLLDNQAVLTPDGRTLQEYVPELLRASRDEGGSPVLENAEVVKRTREDGTTNPYTGWGFSATRRATDASGCSLGVIDNQEVQLRGPRRWSLADGSRLSRVDANGNEAVLASFRGVP
jgi:hypothetical protein